MSIPREEVFEAAEFEARRVRVRARMEERGLDTLVVHGAPNIYYLCGHHTMNLWDYQCLVLPREGAPVLVLWQFERGRFEASGVDAEVDLYPSHADPVEHTRLALERRGLLGGTIGLEARSRYLVPAVRERLVAALAPARTEDASPLVDLVRLVKSGAEVALMRRAGRVTDDAVRAGYAAIREGATDSDVAAAVAAELIRRDSLPFAVHPIVSAGYRAGMPHNTNGGRRIERGETVFIECSPALHWYNAPLMRTASLGPPSDRAKEFAALAAETVAAMLEVIRPGVAACEVAQAAAGLIAPVRERILFHEVYGYPVGIGFPPTWAEESGFAIVLGERRELTEGMVFHIPMTLRINGEFGVGLSHTVVVTAGGCERLSELPLELERLE